MYLISPISSNPNQLIQLPTLPSGGATASFTLVYSPNQYGWFITNFTYNDFSISGLRVTNHPNLLYQFQNLIPIGLACFTANNREPTQQQDFLSGQAQLFLLDQQDVDNYTFYISTGVFQA